ncbi:hypothetical protein B0H14DRAFT_3152386 [Mycena olivaceomarginata]|nr:hypothetical protein B0H14DRAFT_3152386 [Mycena olivaceomarginata]
MAPLDPLQLRKRTGNARQAHRHPPTTRALIRHVRVSGDPLMVYWDRDDEEDVHFRTSQVLNILPGLALDRLTILGPWISEVCYDTLGMLVRHGVGWKELYFLAYDSTFFADEHDSSSFVGGACFLRVPQPAGWQRAFDERDGNGASVAIYRATSSHSCSVLLQPTTRARFAQALPPGKSLKTFGREADASLMVPGEREKEMLVVVRCGRGVDYVEKEDSPYLAEGDMREWMAGRTWAEVRTGQEHAVVGHGEAGLSLVNQYTHVDEYRWQTARSTLAGVERLSARLPEQVISVVPSVHDAPRVHLTILLLRSSTNVVGSPTHGLP